jgi:hypothetical protein
VSRLREAMSIKVAAKRQASTVERATAASLAYNRATQYSKLARSCEFNQT